MKYFLTVTLFAPLLLIGQNVLKGKIISSKTKQPIAFATVGSVKQNIGINTDENGSFELNSARDFLNDTLLISSVGFEKKRVVVADFRNPITLEEKDSVLKDVVVVSKKDWKTETLNDFPSKTKFFYTTTSSETQIAIHYKLPLAKGYLKSVKLVQATHALKKDQKALFRIRVYGFDSATKKPAEDLCSDIIEVRSDKKIINVDLEQYKIYIPNKDFFVAMEWIFTSENNHVDHYKQDGIDKIWSVYLPMIGWSDQNVDNLEVWRLDFRNNWRGGGSLIAPQSGTPQISVTVKY